MQTLKYEESVQQPTKIYDLSIFKNPTIQKALDGAMEMYYFELVDKGHSPLTVGTYCSDVGRFIMFLKEGKLQKNRTQ